MVHYSHRDSPITARGEDETVMRKGPTGQLDKWPAAAVSASPFLSFPPLPPFPYLILSSLPSCSRSPFIVFFFFFAFLFCLSVGLFQCSA
jgi:hypothetical protein